MQNIYSMFYSIRICRLFLSRLIGPQEVASSAFDILLSPPTLGGPFLQSTGGTGFLAPRRDLVRVVLANIHIPWHLGLVIEDSAASGCEPFKYMLDELSRAFRVVVRLAETGATT